MKKLIGLILIAAMFASCSSQHYEKNIDKKVTHIGVKGVIEIEVDSCEYVFYKYGYGGGLSHKGNCKYCAERE